MGGEDNGTSVTWTIRDGVMTVRHAGRTFSVPVLSGDYVACGASRMGVIVYVNGEEIVNE